MSKKAFIRLMSIGLFLIGLGIAVYFIWLASLPVETEIYDPGDHIKITDPIGKKEPESMFMNMYFVISIPVLFMIVGGIGFWLSFKKQTNKNYNY